MVTIKTKQAHLILEMDRGTYVHGLETTDRTQFLKCLTNMTSDDLEVNATGILRPIRTLCTELCCVN